MNFFCSFAYVVRTKLSKINLCLRTKECFSPPVVASSSWYFFPSSLIIKLTRYLPLLYYCVMRKICWINRWTLERMNSIGGVLYILVLLADRVVVKINITLGSIYVICCINGFHNWWWHMVHVRCLFIQLFPYL